MLVTGSYFHPSNTSVDKAGAYPCGVTNVVSFLKLITAVRRFIVKTFASKFLTVKRLQNFMFESVKKASTNERLGLLSE